MSTPDTRTQVRTFDGEDEAEAAESIVLRATRPEPDVRFLLRRVSICQVKFDDRYSVERLRREWRLMVRALATRAPVATVDERVIPGPAGPLRVRVYTPRHGCAPRPLLVWCHGGGFMAGDLYTAGATARALANHSGAVVVAVDYRLVPEHDIHAGYDDCHAALRWAAEHAADVGGDAGRLAVGGDSAGGTIAAAVALRAGREGLPLAGQLLVYPGTDIPGRYPSHAENASGYMLTAQRLKWIHGQLRSVDDLADPELSPLQTAVPAGTAPAVVVTAGYDLLRDEELAFVDHLRRAGVPVRLLHYPGQIHGFISFDRVLAGGRDALRRVGTSLAALCADGTFGPEDIEPEPYRGLGPRGLLHTSRQSHHELRVAGEWVADLAARRFPQLLMRYRTLTRI